MIVIDEKLVDKLLIETKNVNENDKLFKILVEKYKDQGIRFHEVFLRSRLFKKMGSILLDELVREINNLNIDNKTEIITDLAFIKYVMDWHGLYLEKCRSIIHSWNNKICAEDILAYMEYLFNLIKSGKSFLGKQNDERLTTSHLNHMHYSLDVLIELINSFPVRFSMKEPSIIKGACEELFLPLSYMKHIRSIFEEISIQFSKPCLTRECWLLTHECKYWSKMEKYRDLNYEYQEEYDNTTDEMVELMTKTGALRIYGDNFLWRIDGAKALDFSAAKKLHQKYKLLYPLFGELDTEFLFNKKNYTIKMLISLYESIQVLVGSEADDKPLKKNLWLLGRKKLIRLLQLEDCLIAELIDLMAYDFDKHKDKPQSVHWKPLFKKGDIFFIVPSHAMCVSPEKALDKILSTEVEVSFDEGNGNGRKGLAFEKSVEILLNSLHVPNRKVAQNRKRNIPEIDGIFSIDEYVFVYEAKASIKPEGLIEMYNQLSSILYKAKEQLDYRVDIILNNKEKRDYIEQECGFSFEGKKLAPFILVNNPMFAGYKEFKNKGLNLHYPIVYLNDLQSILKNRVIPVWKYNKRKDEYRRTEKPIRTGKEVWEFMLEQFDFLKSIEDPIFVCGDDKIAYQISKPCNIFDPYKEEDKY